MATGTALLALTPSAPPVVAQQPDPPAGRAVEVRVIERDDFHWGDAAVGALAGVGLTALCAGVIVATDRKRRSTS